MPNKCVGELLTMMKTAVLFYYIGTAPAYVAAAKLAMKSLRSTGEFRGDILMFTDQPQLHQDQGETIISVGEKDFLSRFSVLNQSSRNWSLIFKPFMGLYFDASKYDRLIYMDVDVLCHSSIAPIFSAISENNLHFTYAPNATWLDQSASDFGTHGPFLRDKADVELLASSPVAQASVTGVCAGIFGTSGQAFDHLMAPWRDLIIRSFSDGQPVLDQMALNECLLNGDIPGIAFPNEWIAYPLWKVLGKKDLREFDDNQTKPILYHFNPLSAEVKLGYMRAFQAFGPVNEIGI